MQNTLTAFDEAKSQAVFFSPRADQYSIIGRSRYATLQKEVYIHIRDYGPITYRTKLDSMMKYTNHEQEPERAYMLNAVTKFYDNLDIAWGDFQKIDKGIYEITDLNTQSVYVVERCRARYHEKPEYEISLKEWNEDAETIKDKIKGTWEYYAYYRWNYHIIFYRKEITNQIIKD